MVKELLPGVEIEHPPNDAAGVVEGKLGLDVHVAEPVVSVLSVPHEFSDFKYNSSIGR